MGRWGIALAVVLVLPGGDAVAQPCESELAGGRSLSEAETAERYAYIEKTLRSERRKGRIWNHGWGWGLLAASAGQAGAVYVDIPGVDCEPCLWVGAGKAFLGAGSTFIRRVRVDTVAPKPAPSCEDLADAEAKLAAAAKSERIHWMRRAEGYAVNVAGLAYLGFVEDEWVDGAIGFAIGVVVGEIRLYTRPDGAISAVKDYKVGRVDAADDTRFAWTVAPLLSDEGFGLSLLGVF